MSKIHLIGFTLAFSESAVESISRAIPDTQVTFTVEDEIPLMSEVANCDLVILYGAAEGIFTRRCKALKDILAAIHDRTIGLTGTDINVWFMDRMLSVAGGFRLADLKRMELESLFGECIREMLNGLRAAQTQTPPAVE